uniref:Cytochrome P450 monooxygenase sdnQ n=1 Tax=Sordaria araneosa TaxID=573841 RepID=SDNQ_SORAA|nr:RecName: Full=Cytochrome P450 monooxygenase sdnQ; AltName: Full=Sordarin/hypoxysordarin biosynthesis cluster protein Q [Sordaria araneosa]BAV32161.1 cytochrome P450 monooxygenase [Sordaria araneosa]
MDDPSIASGFQQGTGRTTGANGTQIQREGLDGLLRQYPIQCIGTSLLVALLTTIIIYYSSSSSFPSATIKKTPPIPEINPLGGIFYPSKTKAAITAYLTNARGLVTDFFRQNPGKLAAQLHTQIGTIIVLASSTAEEIAHDERFHLRKQTAKTFNAHLPGFEVFRDDYNNHLMKNVVTKYFNKQLTKVTGILAHEMDLALGELFTTAKEGQQWTEIPLHATALQIVARLSGRVFLGEDLGRDPEWLRITAGYAGVVTMAFADLSKWPAWLRSTANRFLPRCKASREYMDGVRRKLRPVIAQRRKERRTSSREYREYNDAIEWFELESNGNAYDPEIVQLSLSLAAIHTAGDLLAQTLTEVATHCEIIEPLKEEMRGILAKGGWQKSSLDKMILLDSVIKESQRRKPLATLSMGRIAVTDAKLSDGTVVPKDSTVSIDAGLMWDPSIYAQPDEWDPYRFVRQRKGSLEKQRLAELTTTAPEHLAFGHGMHACPGRFFAANEVKIAMIKILLGYDIKFADGVEPKVMVHGITLDPDRRVRLSIWRREDGHGGF